MFLKKEKKYNEEGEEIEEEEPELEEGEEKSYEGYIVDTEISPSHVVLLTAEDKFLIDRVKNLSEEKIAGTHYTLNDMKRRLKQYRTDNNSVVGEFSVIDFFA